MLTDDEWKAIDAVREIYMSADSDGVLLDYVRERAKQSSAVAVEDAPGPATPPQSDGPTAEEMLDFVEARKIDVDYFVGEQCWRVYSNPRGGFPVDAADGCRTVRDAIRKAMERDGGESC